MRKQFFALIIFTLFLGGCGYEVVPERTEGVQVSESGSGLFSEKDGIAIRVIALKSNEVPGDVEKNFTVFRVQVDNQTDREINIKPSDFRLFDRDRFQHDSINPGAVAGSIPKSRNHPVRFNVGLGRNFGRYTHAGVGTSWGAGRSRDDAAELAAQAFRAGPIAPDSKKGGYVFFNRVDKHEDRLKFTIMRKGSTFMEFFFNVIKK